MNPNASRLRRGGLPFPLIQLREPSSQTDPLRAVRQIFPGSKRIRVRKLPGGLIQIVIGHPTSAVFRTKIRNLRLTPDEQYNPLSAITAIDNTGEVRAVMTHLGLAFPLTYIEELIVEPDKKLPHLPPTVQDTTVGASSERSTVRLDVDNTKQHWYDRAERARRARRHALALGNYLKAAELGDVRAMYTVAQYYDGLAPRSIRPDFPKALSWYKKVFRHWRDGFSANNIGCILRDQGNRRGAMRWFKQAIAAGAVDSNLDIAKMYIAKNDYVRARPYLQAANRKAAIADVRIQAARLLSSLPAGTQRRRGRVSKD